MNPDQMRDASLLELFQLETRNQVQVLNNGLLALEHDPTSAAQLEACMRAAHSLKGAARIVDLHPAVRIAHAMEDCLVAAQEGRLTRLSDVDTAHHGLVLREHVDEAFLLEAHQRVAHRRLAHAEARREIGARQQHARRQVERDDALAQVVEHLRRRVARAVEAGRASSAFAYGKDL